MYKKRCGTAGIRGHLYESKLISLLQFRAKHDKRIDNFLLATNVNDIGAFDDICFRANIKGIDKPIAAFIQAKHKENDQSLTLLKSKDLTKYFKSYLQIRQAFQQSRKELLFDGVFEEVECLFVMYTSARVKDTEHAPLSPSVLILNDLIGTGDPPDQKACNKENVELLKKTAVKEEIGALAGQVANFICGKSNCKTILNNKLIHRYHVLLAQKVFQTQLRSDDEDGYQNLSIRKDFVQISNDNPDECLMIFKHALCLEILKLRHIDRDDIMANLNKLFHDRRNNYILSKLIGSIVTFDDGKLKFVNSGMFSDEIKKKLSKVYVSEATVKQAIELGATSVLESCKLRVPTAFGNYDLTMRGNENKINERLDHLVATLAHLIEQGKPDNIITIDNSEPGLLRLNGGLGSAVGNILVHDSETKLLKLTENSEGLKIKAKMLFDKLTSRIENLDTYRFEVKDETFPTLTFDCSEHNTALVKDFLNKLVIFSNQADESGVEETLRNEIEEQNDVMSNLKVRLIYLKYHDAIQKWWMTRKEAPYLTERCRMYDDIVRSIVKDPLISIIHMMYRNKTRNVEYTFKEDAVMSLGLQEQNSTNVVVSSNVTLTTAKIIQYFKSNQHAVIDLESVTYLLAKDFISLCEDLQKSKENILIVICEVTKYSRHWCRVLEKVARAVHDKQTIIVTNEASKTFVKQYFPSVNDFLNDRHALRDLTDETQISILDNASITFQGQQITLNSIVDDESMSFIEGEVLNKIVKRETLEVGKAVGNQSYDEVKHLYVERRMCRGRARPKRYRDLLNKDTDIHLETLYDINDDVVLVTAKPGMGKSILLTHLSLTTKELDPNVWIVRVNLLEYSREFNEWHQNETVIDKLEATRFLCRVTLSEERRDINRVTITLEETNGVMRLKDSSIDDYTTFELKMFLHFCNSKRIIFLFDGFDEICPHYTKEVLNLLKTVRSFPAKHKIWVASRSYNIIKSTLRREFGTAYEIQPFSIEDREEYLEKFWLSNLDLKEFNDDQLKNIHEFVKYITDTDLSAILNQIPLNKVQFVPLYYIYFSALEHIQRTWYFVKGIKDWRLILIL